MKISTINSQNFGSFVRPVRLVSKYAIGQQYLLKYEKPNAQFLFKAAQKSPDLKEAATLYEMMGEYDIIDLNRQKRIAKFISTKLP